MNSREDVQADGTVFPPVSPARTRSYGGVSTVTMDMIEEISSIILTELLLLQYCHRGR